MTTLGVLDLEQEELSFIDTDSTPPCEAIIGNAGPRTGELCGNPSVARVRFTCNPCNHSDPIFICQRCLDLLINKPEQVICNRCYSPDITWRYM